MMMIPSINFDIFSVTVDVFVCHRCRQMRRRFTFAACIARAGDRSSVHPDRCPFVSRRRRRRREVALRRRRSATASGLQIDVGHTRDVINLLTSSRRRRRRAEVEVPLPRSGRQQFLSQADQVACSLRVVGSTEETTYRVIRRAVTASQTIGPTSVQQPTAVIFCKHSPNVLN